MWDYDAPPCTRAVKQGDDEILKWLRTHVSLLREQRCEALPVRGRLDLSKWFDELGCRGGSWTFRIAAEHGQLDIVMWFHESGCTLNDVMCTLSARNGDQEVLQYLHRKACPWNAATCAAAAE